MEVTLGGALAVDLGSLGGRRVVFRAVLKVDLGFVDERHVGITFIFGHSYLNLQRAGTCPESSVLPFGCSQHCTYLNEGQRKYAITMVSAYLNIPSIRECRLGTRRYKNMFLENNIFNIYFLFSKAIVGSGKPHVQHLFVIIWKRSDSQTLTLSDSQALRFS